jgi:uncharacterized protein (DUF2252 family)
MERRMIDIEKMKAHATEVANDTTVCGNQIEREWAKTVLSLLSELEAREAALRQIAAIEDKMYGGDWDEIEEARRIAGDALNGRK